MQIKCEASVSSLAINVNVEADQRLQDILKLDGRTEANGFDATDGDKIAALATAALDIAAVNFPILSESAWLLLLDAQHKWAGNPLSAVRNTPKSQNCNYFKWLLSTDDLSYDAGPADVDAVKNLSEDSALAVYLVGNMFWSKGNADLRRILSRVSGRPHECVYQGDPKPKDLWRIVRIKAVSASVKQVFLAFGDDAETGFVEIKMGADSTACEQNLDFRFTQSRDLPDQFGTLQAVEAMRLASTHMLDDVAKMVALDEG